MYNNISYLRWWALSRWQTFVAEYSYTVSVTLKILFIVFSVLAAISFVATVILLRFYSDSSTGRWKTSENIVADGAFVGLGLVQEVYEACSWCARKAAYPVILLDIATDMDFYDSLLIVIDIFDTGVRRGIGYLQNAVYWQRINKNHVNRWMPALRYDVIKEEVKAREECAVCLGELRDEDMVRVVRACNHGFHVPCIDGWLTKSSLCPLCRSPVYDPPSD